MCKKLSDLEYEVLIWKYIYLGYSYKKSRIRLERLEDGIVISYFSKPESVVI